MDKLQLRMTKYQTQLIIEALAVRIEGSEITDEAQEFTELLTYFRYRLARAGRITGESISR